ncbi:hypothetical protein EZS27_027300 [termite gut metagenome]|uniref:Uncharacterized protein n=1 Tax=termite gut metagenome TaxID=433724 RepID=A0A5J4QQH0_9ZZZZ
MPLSVFRSELTKPNYSQVFLENKRMILKEDKCYLFNPDFHY